MGVGLDLPLIYLLGVETAFTPCFFPIIPVFLSYISRSGSEKVFLASLLFAAGITSSFTLYGVAAAYSAGIVQVVLSLSLELITVELGIVFIGLGAAMMTPFKEALALLSVPTPRIRKITLANAFTLGFLFSLVAAPCAATYIFAILSTTLLKAMGGIGYAILQLAVYGAGISTPFVAIGVAAQKLGTRALSGVSRSFLVKYNEEIAGAITLLLGLVTMASVEDFPLYLGQAAAALRPFLLLLFAATGAYYGYIALRAASLLGDRRAAAVAAGFLAAAGGLVAEAASTAGLISPPPAWAVAATRGALFLGSASLLPGSALVYLWASEKWLPLAFDAAAAASWVAVFGRLRDSKHMWGTLYMAGLAAYDATWALPMPGWARAAAAAFCIVGALNLYPAAARNRGALAGIRILLEEDLFEQLPVPAVP